MMQEDSPAKRPRTMSSYMDVCAENWVTKFLKANGSYKKPLIYIHHGNDAPEFTLFTKDEPCGIIPFPLNVPPSQSLQQSKVSGVNMVITVTEEQACFIEQVEGWFCGQAFANSLEWFGKEHSHETIKTMFSPSLKRNSRHPPNLRGKLILNGPESSLTRVVYRDSDGNNKKLRGFEEVVTVLDNNWKGFDARCAISIHSAWIVGDRFGMRINFTDLLVIQPTRPLEMEEAFLEFPP